MNYENSELSKIVGEVMITLDNELKKKESYY
jgi:hypothetical protein